MSYLINGLTIAEVLLIAQSMSSSSKAGTTANSNPSTSKGKSEMMISAHAAVTKVGPIFQEYDPELAALLAGSL